MTAREIEVLPAPEGEAMTSMTPRRANSAISSAYSMFWTCSRNWSMTALRSRPMAVSSTALDLEHRVFASRLNSCDRKSSLRPTGPPSAISCAGRSDVGAQPVEFLADIGLGGEQHGFLAPAGPRTAPAPASPRSAICWRSRSRMASRLAAGMELGGLASAPRSRRCARSRIAASRRPRRAARDDQIGDGRVDGGKDGGLQRLLGSRPPAALVLLEHALEAKDAVERRAWRRRVSGRQRLMAASTVASACSLMTTSPPSPSRSTLSVR